MQGMVLAAGGAPRLYPLTYALPMPMVPMVNRPILEHTLGHLRRHGMDEVMINLHLLPRYVTDYFGESEFLGTRLRYSVEPDLLGTAGGVRQVADFFRSTFLVIGGDLLTDLDLGKLIAFHQERGALATLGVVRRDNPSEVGVVATDEQGRVMRYQEKPRADEVFSPLCNTGIYVFEPAIFELIPNIVYDFGRQLFPRLVQEGRAFYALELEGYWRDVGDLMSYRQGNRDFLEGRVGLPLPGSEVKPGVWLDEHAFLHPEANVVPPVVLGRGAHVEAGVRLEGPVVLGDGVVLEEGVQLSSSVIWDASRINREAEVSDALVGAGCVLEGGHRYRQVVLGSGSRFTFKTPQVAT
ncbi:MAG: hypothetical protein AMXMBFR33_64300 [Candidatus Xenobia bacterium]|jgi:NDP-sugar pyrophosphorylase family protein